jgi:cytosine/creatinine deaminase
MNLVVRNACFLEADALRIADIGVAGGSIVAIEPCLKADTQEIDASGCLVVPGMVETHIHLDKTCILDRCQIEEGTVAEAVRQTASVKGGFTVEDVYARGKKTLERCISHGTTRMRTHVELDPGIGMIGFEAIEQLARDYAWALDVELCVFPQEGLTNNPGTEELLIEGLRRGARTIGPVPYFDTDPRKQIDRIFAIARDFDAEIDMHLDLAESVDGMQVEYVCRKTEESGWGDGLPSVMSRRCRCCRRSALPPSPANLPIPALPSRCCLQPTCICGPQPRSRGAARRCAGRAAAQGGRNLLDLDQQRPQSVHALWRRLVDPDS